MFSKYVEIAGTPTHYFHSGPSTLPGIVPALAHGELLVFVHGAGSNANTWRHQVEHFGARHSAVSFDLPAHGRSAATDGLATLAAMVDHTVQFATALRLRPFVLVGRAMGAAIAVEVAASHPDLVRALALVAMPIAFAIPPAALETWRDVSRGRKTQPFSTDIFSPKTDFAVMREAWMEQVKTDPRVRYTDLSACDGVDLSARLPRIEVPTLVITGSDDHFAPPEKAEAVRKTMPRARLAVIADAGHTLTSEKPQEFNQALDEFLGSLDR